MSEPKILRVVLDANKKVRSVGMAFGRKPTWVIGPVWVEYETAGPDIKMLVLHVVGGVEYTDEGQRYAPSRFLVLRVLRTTEIEGLGSEYECQELFAIRGIPKKDRRSE